MSGTFSIHNKPTVILFDSGATHSFIRAKFGAMVGLDGVEKRFWTWLQALKCFGSQMWKKKVTW